MLYRQPAADPAPPAPEALAELAFIPAEEDRVRFAAPVLLRPLALSAAPSPPRPLGEVAVELSVAIAQARWHRGLAWDSGLVLLTFAGATGLAHWTSETVGAIRRIATAIERIKRGDFAVRVRPTDRNELGTLQDGVNLLAETLAHEQARLDLELTKVRAEYQQALDDLQVQTRAAERANAAELCVPGQGLAQCAPPCTRFRGWSNPGSKPFRTRPRRRPCARSWRPPTPCIATSAIFSTIPNWSKGNTRPR